MVEGIFTDTYIFLSSIAQCSLTVILASVSESKWRAFHKVLPMTNPKGTKTQDSFRRCTKFINKRAFIQNKKITVDNLSIRVLNYIMLNLFVALISGFHKTVRTRLIKWLSFVGFVQQINIISYFLCPGIQILGKHKVAIY